MTYEAKIKAPGGEFTYIEPGVWKAKVEKLDTVMMTFGRTMKITFDVLDDDGESVGPLDGLASFPEDGFSSKSKLYGWYSVIMGTEPEIDQTVKLDDMIGKVCLLNVVDDKKDDGRTFSKVESVMPAKKKAKAAASF